MVARLEFYLNVILPQLVIEPALAARLAGLA